MAGPQDRSGRLVYEVFPYASIRRLMGGNLHYKNGRLAEKRQGCFDLFKAMKVQNPQL